MPFDLLDKVLCFFLVSLPMMDGMNKPTTRQHIDKGPSIAHIVACAFVFAEPGFFLKCRTSDSFLKMDIRAVHEWSRLKAACL
jgi:hypothetical protein